MTASQRILYAALALSALFAGPTVALDQDPPSSERRVLVFRAGGDPRIDLEEVAGHRGFLGVGLLDLTPELRAHFGVVRDRGIMISSVVAGSPAERAGLLPADILTAADGEPLTASIDLSIRVARAAEGTRLELERWRDGRKETLPVQIEIRPRSHLDISPLIARRIGAEGGHRIKFHTVGDGTEHIRWVEEVVESVGDSFSEATFVQQLEALRRERNGLLQKLDQMEERLKALEAELHGLDSDGR